MGSTEQVTPARRRPRPRVGDVIARRVSGTAIRDAMDRRDIGLKELAARTREQDPSGRGVSWQLISFLASSAWWSRDTTTLATAQLIAEALGEPLEHLFTPEAVVSRRRARRQDAA